MTITKIEAQKNNEKRYSVYIDEKFAFGLSNIDVLYYKLKEYEEISEDKVDKILNETVFVKARDVAYKYLGFKQRTQKEVVTRLLDEGFTEHIIEKVICLLKEYDYINDEKYAREYVKNQIEFRGYGQARIETELKIRGVSAYIVQDLFEEISIDQSRLALKHLEKKLKGYPIEDIKEKQRCTAYLLRRGFLWSHIDWAIKSYEGLDKD